MNVVDPRVSTASRLRTSALRAAIRWAPMASDSVTVGNRPSGTRATVTPTANRNPSRASVPERQREAEEGDADSERDEGDRPHHTMELAGQRAARSSDPGA